MRWSIVRLIWHRELRDQLRDRRTLFMIAVLPMLLYPVAGFGIVQMALGYLGKRSVIGIHGQQYLPPLTPRCTAFSPVPELSWLTAAPAGPGVPLAGVARVMGAAALERTRRVDPGQDYPPLLLRDSDRLQFPAIYLDAPEEARAVIVRPLDGPVPAVVPPQFDLLLIVPPDFQQMLHNDGRPPLYILTRQDDESSRLVDDRVARILRRWKEHLKAVRLLRRGLPADYDQAIEVRDAAKARPPARRASDELLDMLVRIFPFILVLWSLAGALYPAVDLCAGEKERGTMETLLISPASRAEIVCGKFLTIWVFSAATALLNLLSMALTMWRFGSMLTVHASLRPAALFWAVTLLLPLSAFFSAICLAIGAYARSSKEGQYYLMPLFLVTLPLVFLTLVPGVELNHFYSMVPVTGVALLLQRLMAVKPPDGSLWGYFVPVLAPMVVYSWLALRWAIEQFQREEVLFREAERLDMSLWLRRLLRDKDALPSAGQAFFCFALIFGLHWLSLSIGGRVSVLSFSAIRYMTFVAAPPLFMVLMLTTRPRHGLSLRLPSWRAWPVAITLAVLLLPPFIALTLFLLDHFPHIRQSLLEIQSGSQSTGAVPSILPLLILGVLPALCEELAFRGFILSGLRQRFRPWTAILLSGFLYALYQMNVFQAVPHFLAGAILALLVVRTGSVLPAMAFHLVWNILLLAPALQPSLLQHITEAFSHWSMLGPIVVLACLALAAPLLALLLRRPLPGIRPIPPPLEPAKRA